MGEIKITKHDFLAMWNIGSNKEGQDISLLQFLKEKGAPIHGHFFPEANTWDYKWEVVDIIEDDSKIYKWEKLA